MNKKDIQKLLVISVVNYALILAVSFIISLILSELFSVVLIIMTILSTFLLVYHWYYTKKPQSPLKDGFIVGLILALITFFIEFSLWFYNFGWFYFLNFFVLAQYILIIIVPIFAALFKEEKKIMVKEKVSTRGSKWKDRLSN